MFGALRPLLHSVACRRSLLLRAPLSKAACILGNEVSLARLCTKRNTFSIQNPTMDHFSGRLLLPLNASPNRQVHALKPFMRTNVTLLSTVKSVKPATDVEKPSMINRAKAMMKHYVDGSKLLAYETRASVRLLRKILRGESLIRREYLQLLRTSRDMFRLVPFVIIMIVPFLEFALPVLLKLFPNMLPSTFEDKSRANTLLRKQIVAKMNVAKFLQDTADSMAKENQQMKKIKHILEQARTPGKSLREDDLVSVCKALGEQSSLDNLGRKELQQIAHYMELRMLWLPTSFLRRRIRRSLRALRRDDDMIQNEGVSSLTEPELRAACHARGIYSDGVSIGYLRRELDSWIRLHIVHCIPAPVLILSRAYAITSALNVDEAMQKAVVVAADNLDITQPAHKLADAQSVNNSSNVVESFTTSRLATGQKIATSSMTATDRKLEKQVKRVKSEAKADKK